jgi:hypothetical protein
VVNADPPTFSADASDPTAWTLRWTVNGTRTLNLNLVDEHGLANAEPITQEINRYMASPLSGLQFGALLGLLLTFLAGLGNVSLLWSRQSWTLCSSERLLEVERHPVGEGAVVQEADTLEHGEGQARAAGDAGGVSGHGPRGEGSVRGTWGIHRGLGGGRVGQLKGLSRVRQTPRWSSEPPPTSSSVRVPPG